MRKRVAVIEGRRVCDFVAADATKPSTWQSKLSPPVASVKVAEELFSTSPLGTGGLGTYLALVPKRPDVVHLEYRGGACGRS